MAIHFTPKSSKKVPTELSESELLYLAHETAVQQGFAIVELHRSGFTAVSQNGLLWWNHQLRVEVKAGEWEIESRSVGNELIDWGKNRRKVATFLHGFERVSRTFVPETDADTVAAWYAELPAVQPQMAETVVKWSDLLVPHGGYFITPILLYLNLAIYLVMVISGTHWLAPDVDSLLSWGANLRMLTADGDLWRLLSSCFVHVGLVHLLFNMYALLYIGTQLEPVLGRWQFLAAYLLSGIAASTNSMWWHDLTVSAGASGAIFGMYGLFLALLTTSLFPKNTRQPLMASMVLFVGYNLVFGTQEGIDNAAHLGGLLSGLVFGFAYLPSLRDKAEPYLGAATSGVLVMVVAIGVFFSVKYLPNDLATYQQKMEKFVAQEALALEVYNLPEGSSNASILYGLQERGIYYWRENLKILNTVDKLSLPAHLVERNRLLREYCQLRIRHYRLLYKAIDEETEAYQKQIEHYDRQLGIVLQKIKGE